MFKKLFGAGLIIVLIAAAFTVFSQNTVFAQTNVAGSWRPYSESIFYDRGGNKSIVPVTRRMTLSPNGQWSFGTSSGKWHVETITQNDWDNWKINPYGPTKKIVLSGWNKSTAEGPIEESSGNIDFIWVIYRTQSSFGPATVWIKFGH